MDFCIEELWSLFCSSSQNKFKIFGLEFFKFQVYFFCARLQTADLRFLVRGWTWKFDAKVGIDVYIVINKQRTWSCMLHRHLNSNTWVTQCCTYLEYFASLRPKQCPVHLSLCFLLNKGHHLQKGEWERNLSIQFCNEKLFVCYSLMCFVNIFTSPLESYNWYTLL